MSSKPAGKISNFFCFLLTGSSCLRWSFEMHKTQQAKHDSFLFEDSSLSDSEFRVRMLHKNSRGRSNPINKKRDRDVIAYPVPECMCKHATPIF